MVFCPVSFKFCLIRMKFSTDVHRNLLNYCEFHGKRRLESPTILRGVNYFLCVLDFLLTCSGEILYKRSEAVDVFIKQRIPM
jgi:hypothetical protein